MRVLSRLRERNLDRVLLKTKMKHDEILKTKKEILMAQFMVTATYTDSAFAGMANNPHNREQAIGKILSALNMSLESLHMTLGGKLFMVVSGTAEAGGALMIVAGASGSVTDITVDEVFSAADQMDWMQSASAVMGAYKPANAQ
jgi:uncharacterized protein with GYD domain